MSGKHWYVVDTVYKTSQYGGLCDFRYVYEASEQAAVNTALADITRKKGHGGYQLESVSRAVREYANVQFFTWKGELNMSGKLETKLILNKRYPVVAFQDPTSGFRTVREIRSRKGEPASSAYLITTYVQTPLPLDLGDSYTITSLGRAWKMIGRVTVPTDANPKQYVQKIVREEMSKYMRDQIDSVSCALNQL
jgi:hypothetical protein